MFHADDGVKRLIRATTSQMGSARRRLQAPTSLIGNAFRGQRSAALTGDNNHVRPSVTTGSRSVGGIHLGDASGDAGG